MQVIRSILSIVEYIHNINKISDFKLDTRFRGIPNVVDGDEEFSNEMECLSSCIIKSGEEVKKVEVTVYIDDVA